MAQCTVEIPIQNAYPAKDPDARKDYTLGWRKWLSNPETGELIDTIASAVFAVTGTGLTPDLVIFAQSFDETTATIWVVGGVVGKTYWIRCRVTTVAGRIDDACFPLRIEQRCAA